MDLGQKDLAILYELTQDARQPASIIGKKTGLGKESVEQRIQELEQKKVITNYYSVIDSFKLGFEVIRVYIKYHFTNPLIEQKIIDHFKSSKLIWALYTVNGWIDLDIILWVKNRYDFYEFWKKTLLKYSTYFEKQIVSYYIKTIFYPYSYLINDTSNRKPHSIITGSNNIVKLDSIDYKILQILSNNARIPLSKIALDLNKQSIFIKEKINELYKQNIICGYRAALNLHEIGYRFYKADINLSDYRNREKIIQYLLNNPNLIGIDETVGTSHLELELHLKDNAEFMEIMDDISNKFQNTIRNYQFLTVNENLKLNYFPQ